MRYNTASGGAIEYSNGVVWNTLTSNVQKSIVVAKKTSGQTINDQSETTITNWDELTDLNNNFNYTTGVFTAPRSGNYLVSFSFNFFYGGIANGTQVEAILRYTVGGVVNFKKSLVGFPAGGGAQAGSSLSFVINLEAGDTVRPRVWHNLGVNRNLRVTGSIYDDGFVNFSVVEL